MPKGSFGEDSNKNLKNKGKIIPFKRKRNYKNLFITLFLIVIVVAVLLFTPLFNINSVEVTGNERFKTEDIIKLSGIPIGQNIFKVNYFKTKDQLLSNPYIEKVSISRNYPSKVKIAVTERRQAGYIAFAPNSYAVIDKQGYVVEAVENANNIKAPVILGVKFKDFKVANTINVVPEDKAKFELVKNCFNQIETNGLGGMINKIDVSNPLRIAAEINNGKFQVNLMDDQKLDYKFKMLSKEILPDLEKSKSPAGTIDFTIVNKPTFKPR